jgi:NAD(P)-dependent dehydrogenase (short-subunit alcohol dehydrogenase family)
LSISGSSIVITGAASGIGRAVAKQLHADGARLTVADVNEAALVELCDSLGPERGNSLARCGAEGEDNERLVACAVERYGGINGAVLNVGIPGPMKPIIECAVEDFDRVMAVNVRGTWLGLRALIPEIARQGEGAIVLTASTAAHRAGAPGRSPYVTSKHAVLGLMRATAAECAPLNIRVNSVSPGGVDTPMTRGLMEMFGEEKSRQMLAAFESSVPLRRLAQPEEIAGVMCFLLGPQSRYCTGTNIMVDGGLTG